MEKQICDENLNQHRKLKAEQQQAIFCQNSLLLSTFRTIPLAIKGQTNKKLIVR